MPALRRHWGQIIVLWGDLEIWGRAKTSARVLGGRAEIGI